MPLDTQKFLDKIVLAGYTHLCAVPCSFAKDLINGAINHPSLAYIPCASEPVACSLAAGIKMASGKPIVMVQSSGLANMGSCLTSLLKPYAIHFPIIVSWRTYKEGSSEIQHQHLADNLPQLVKAYGYEYEILHQESSSIALEQIEQCNQKNKICLLLKESFSTVILDKEHHLQLPFPKRSEYLQELNHLYKNSKTIFIGTTGNTSREMHTFMPDTNNFYMVGNMGGSLSLGLGAALQKKKIIVCGGDAEFVMHLGGLSTAGRYNGKEIDLTYILFDNESNKSTGGQSTEQKHINYIQLAESVNCNIYPKTVTNKENFGEALTFTKSQQGIKFIYIKCSYDRETPRPPLEKVKTNTFSLINN